MDFIQNNTQALLTGLMISGIGFWMRQTIKEIVERSSDKVASEVRRLTESLNSEITISSHERQTDSVWQQINQQHVSESSAEHERMIDAIKEISEQNGKQNESLQEIVTILKGLHRN